MGAAPSTPDTEAPRGLEYRSQVASHTHAYLLPAVIAELEMIKAHPTERRLFDAGCGNGSVSRVLAQRGWRVSGVDISSSGIEQARRLGHAALDLRVGSLYDDLARDFGQFPVVVSLEVVEHLYDPRLFAKRLHALLQPGGTLIISTPYHGYWKNLALALAGAMDRHYAALWDHGHIKFWSIETLSTLLAEVGFAVLRTHRVGRVPPLAKSMIMVARRPP